MFVVLIQFHKDDDFCRYGNDTNVTTNTDQTTVVSYARRDESNVHDVVHKL